MAISSSDRRRNPLPLVVAAVIGVVAILVTYLILKPDGSSGEEGSDKPRGDCVPLVLSASSEKAGLLTELAKTYNGKNRRFADGKCADVRVFGKASGGSMEALARGWDEGRDGGPAPQVWSPASASWLALLRQRVTGGDKAVLVPEGQVPSIAKTPLVIAMPRPMAEALGWPNKPLGWTDVLGLVTNPQGWASAGHPEWGRFKLGKTNPHFSTSGLNATIATYFAATGRSTDLTAAEVNDPKVRAFVRGVESGVVHYGDTTLTFLANLYEADKRGQGLAYISAVTVEEKSVYDYNEGNPSGDPKQFGKNAKPRVPLVAIYPKEGTLLSDNPYVVLSTASDEQKAAAADYLAFLQEEPQQRRFTDLAFRSHDGRTGPPITEAKGLLPRAQITVIEPPSPQVLALAQQGWDALRKRARVLLVLDVSGSMEELTKSGKNKLELAKQASLQAIGLFAPDDEVGLWTFSSEAQGSSDPPYTERVPIEPVSTATPKLRQVIPSLQALGATALYATTRAAQRKMLNEVDPQRINAVVLLTDGKNEYPKDNDLDGLLRDLDASSLENSVRVFTIGYGEKADMGTLTRIAQASRAAAYDARDPATIDKILTAVLSNF